MIDLRDKALQGRILQVAPALVAALVALSGGLGYESFGPIERVFRDRALRSRAAASADTSAVSVLLVDDASLAELGQRWPLPRKTWADAVSILASYQPAAIAMNVWFEAPEAAPEADIADDLRRELMARALDESEAGKQVIDALDELASAASGDVALADAMVMAPVVLGNTCLTARMRKGTRIAFECGTMSGNIPELADAARRRGVLNLLRDVDGRTRRYPYVVIRGDEAKGSLALEALAVSHPEGDRARRLQVAAVDGAAPYLRPIPPASFDTVTLGDLLLAGPGVPELKARFAGRIVFVGVSASGTEDLETGSLGEALPGVFFHANAAVNLLQGSYLRSDGTLSQVGVVISLALMIGLAILGWRSRRVRYLPVAAAVVSAGWIGFGWFAVDAGTFVALAPVLLGTALWLVAGLGRGWRRLEGRLRRERAAKERLESELAIGREIQESLLPDVAAVAAGVDGANAAARLLPAREVSGDFYHLFEEAPGQLWCCVGDVSDKGVAAALFMAMAKTLVETHARRSGHPGETLEAVNDALARDNPEGMFVTIFLARLDLGTGTLSYASAGHNPSFLRQPSGDWVTLGERHGPVVGAMEGLPYGETDVTLEPSSVLFAYTDGVTEAMDPAGALYGEDRLLALLSDAAPEVEALADVVLASVAAFARGADQSDDLTVLAVRYAGADKSTSSPS